jgi:hypothetical protein
VLLDKNANVDFQELSLSVFEELVQNDSNNQGFMKCCQINGVGKNKMSSPTHAQAINRPCQDKNANQIHTQLR